MVNMLAAMGATTLVAAGIPLSMGVGVLENSTALANNQCGNSAYSDFGAATPTPFRIGSLNWRGAHFAGTPAAHPGEQTYDKRMPHMINALNKDAASIVGFQQFELPQAAAFAKATAGKWGTVTAGTDTTTAIGYATKEWAVEDTRQVTIPTAHGTKNVPLVKFRSLNGLGSVWVLNTAHDGPAATDRADMNAEIKALKQVKSDNPTTAIFEVGDMGDTNYGAAFTAQMGGGWTSATTGDQSWILGGPGVTFSNGIVDQSTNDNAHTLTDHPFLRADVTYSTPNVQAQTASSQNGVSAQPVGSAATPASGAGMTIAGKPLSAEQVHNAEVLVSTATARSGTQAAVVIITTALTETHLVAEPGIGGAYGVLQQTPSAGWGTVAQVMDPQYAANAFMDHLSRIPNWQTMPVQAAAQNVQGSGAGTATINGKPVPRIAAPGPYPADFGRNYTPNITEAQAIVTQLSGTNAYAFSNCAQATAMMNGGGAGVGKGPFVPNTSTPYVGSFDPATLMARAQDIQAHNGQPGHLDPFFQEPYGGSWYRACLSSAVFTSGRASVNIGAPYSASLAWSTYQSWGAGHPATSSDGMSPPVGAWLFYGDDHVVVYLGNNLVLGTDTWGKGTDKIGPTADVQNWLASQGGYKGWSPPFGGR